jgi:hypothetical protein
MMKKIKKIVFLLILIISFSCEEQGLIINCPDCTTDKPEKTNLEIKLDKNDFGTEILINVYEGNLEDSVIYSSYYASAAKSTISVILNKKYTLTATYHIPYSVYVAVDSATPSVRYSKDQCENPCYFVYDRVVDLRLKYTE